MDGSKQLRSLSHRIKDKLKLESSTGISAMMKQLNLTTITYQSFRADHQLSARYLCLAAFGLDPAALTYLVNDIGVSVDVIFADENNKTALHCLSVIGTMAGGHKRSQTFSLLNGIPTFATDLLKPSLPIRLSSVHTHTIIDRLTDAIATTARTLLQAGASLTIPDGSGNLFLHHAAQGGLLSLAKVVLEESIANLSPATEYELVNAKNDLNRTPMHYAAANGHADFIALLLRHQGDLFALDQYQVSPYDIISAAGGPISPTDALNILQIQQKVTKTIASDRRIFESNQRSNGGWQTRRLAGYEDESTCDVDQYDASEINGSHVFRNYIALNRPVLIRGLVDDWPLLQAYSKANMLQRFGRALVLVTEIPYPSKFGKYHQGIRSELRDYIINASSENGRLIGGQRPWYVFRSHPIPTYSEHELSLLPYEECKTPLQIHEAIRPLYPGDYRPFNDPSKKGSREMFVNAQFAYGAAGSGAAVG
jgi:hypothetical protein